eukprot:scaffold256054_cov33-Prasinocladus_malaysianus.AAC.1
MKRNIDGHHEKAHASCMTWLVATVVGVRGDGRGSSRGRTSSAMWSLVDTSILQTTGLERKSALACLPAPIKSCRTIYNEVPIALLRPCA